MKPKKLLAALLSVTCALPLAGCTAFIRIDASHYEEADGSLINPDASAEAVYLMQYLKSIYGKQILSGQYINEYEDYDQLKFRQDENNPDSVPTVFKANELQAVHSVTGKYPALLGLDVSGVESGGRCFSARQALEWHNAGGIVTICWHWTVDNLDGKPRAFYTEETDFSLSAALADPNGALYQGLIADIDAVSEELKILRDAHIPVLWRPLHEASGGWFWWGADGADCYRQLWNILYDRMTNYHGLNNLIWVYNGQDPDWYVGDDKCDMIGDDPYYPDNSRTAYRRDPANSKRFKSTYRASASKMIAMTENDFVPSPDAMFDKGTKWLTFCTWCREFVCAQQPTTDGSTVYAPEYGSPYTTAEELRDIYQDIRVITLDTLADSDYRPRQAGQN